MAECYRGIQRAFQDAGVPIHEKLIADLEDYRLESGWQAAQKLLSLDDLPTATLDPQEQSPQLVMLSVFYYYFDISSV